MLVTVPVPFRRISSQFKKYYQIYLEDGRAGLLWVIKDFSHKARKAIFSLEKLYVYEINLGSEIPKLKAKFNDLVVKPIFLPISLSEYEYLGNEGYDFLKHPDALPYQPSMRRGTIVFLTFKDENLMNRTGMTLYRNGAYIKSYPKEFDHEGTVYAGFSETTKEARMAGIYSFVHSYIFNYLKEIGFKRVILLESEEQPGPRKVQDRLGATVIYTIYCIRLFMLLSYWTKPDIQAVHQRKKTM